MNKKDSDKDQHGAKNAKYEVGYQRPPKASRFAKGKSGNPKGRPRGRKSLRASFEAILGQKIKVREGTRVRTISKVDALYAMLVNAGLKGDHDLALKAMALAGKLQADAIREVNRKGSKAALLTDQELIQIVIERKITLQAVLQMMTDEQLEEISAETQRAIEEHP